MGRATDRARRRRIAVAAALLAVALPGFGHAAGTPAPQRVPADAAAPPRDAAARARILECGHQWNNMKRAGTASGTWKDFSRDCLAAR